MRSHLSIAIIMMLTLFTISCCSSQSSTTTEKEPSTTSETSTHTESPDGYFPLPSAPAMITSSEDIILYLSEHYWDLFNFSDTSLITQPDITEQGFVDYIQLLNQISQTDAEKSINIMLNKAKPYPSMYAHFAALYEKYFYDPNSPFRNEQLYTPVVKHLVESEVLSQELQEIFSFQQKMLLKNKIGTTAINFEYTLAKGDKKMMHDLQSNYLILFFTNPDCLSCASTTKQLNNSEVFHELFELNTPDNMVLTVLSIFPDSNVGDWRKALPSLPQQDWINSYDDGEVIYSNLLYDIKAIPTLYLLDRDKKVILKDVDLGEIEEYFIETR
ncbi:MAG: DUF5106 domain-containing protein [Bacteroidales bacterium]|nr:DUF5106 domain-containing protein [Bacteroidales bacterium]